jgi:hypothetical protein
VFTCVLLVAIVVFGYVAWSRLPHDSGTNGIPQRSGQKSGSGAAVDPGANSAKNDEEEEPSGNSNSGDQGDSDDGGDSGGDGGGGGDSGGDGD